MNDHDKSVRFASQALRKGFTALPNAVLLDPDLSADAKTVYAFFTHYAWASEGEWPGLDGMAEKWGIAKRTLQRRIDELKAGTGTCGVLVESRRRGQGLPNAYTIYLPGEQPQSGQVGHSGLATVAGLDTSDLATSLNDEEQTTFVDEVAKATSSTQKNPPTPKGEPRVRFDGKPVPAAVLELAETTLATFNRLAGTHYEPYGRTGKPSAGLRRIIGAAMSLDGLTVEIAERMIRVQFASPYWSGKPRPGNVFGPNVVDGNFEAATWSPNSPAGQSGARTLVDRLDARRAAA